MTRKGIQELPLQATGILSSLAGIAEVAKNHSPEMKGTEVRGMDWLTHIVFWHWWILAGMLLILELTSPVFFFLWLGFSAAAVGFLLLVFPGISLAVQLVLFGILSVVAVFAWRKYRDVRPPGSE